MKQLELISTPTDLKKSHRFFVYLSDKKSKCPICKNYKKIIIRDKYIKLDEIHKCKHCSSIICRLLYRASKNKKFGYHFYELYDLKKNLEENNWFDLFHNVNAHIVNLHSRVKMQPRKKGKLLCNLTTKDAFEILPKNMICPVLQIKMYWGGNRINSPSIDRINNHRGYEKDNIHWISMLANEIKRDYENIDLYKVATYFRKLKQNARI